MGNGEKVPVSEIVKHSAAEDCWVVVNGQVYDLSKFAPEHPGGPEIIYKYAGKDGTELYNRYHSKSLIDSELPTSAKLGEIDSSSITETWISSSSSSSQKEPQTSLQPTDTLTAKPPLSTILNLSDFEHAFSQSGPKKPWAYISSASNDLLTHHSNLSLWQKLWFRPRIMRNVRTLNTHTSLLGCPVKMPVWICPMGIAKTAGPEGEAALGAGAARGGIVHCMSTTASMSVEEILGSVPEGYPYFFQLYVDRKREKTEAVLERLEGLEQIRAVFVTVDLAVVSKREADERLLVGEVTSVYANGVRSGTDRKGAGLARTTGSFIDWALCWEDLPWLRKHTSKPIVVKGIQSAADAKIAMQMGCAGIVVSNHGGRALDNSPGTILILLELKRDCPEVFEKMEVFIDGGVRRGSDVVKAICIGARGVGVGRPFQCAVMYGREGVEHATAILQDEIETAMRLCGITDLNEARGDLSYLNTRELEQLLPSRPLSRSWFSFGSRQIKL